MTNSEKFIEKANIIHNNKYDYSEINYINTHTKVKIICPVHSSFEQSPANHQRGVGCPLCSNINRAKNKTKPFDDFLIKANSVHNNFYIYEKTKFKKRTEKALIICPIHGEFEQIINNHLKGEGCPECGKIKTSNIKTKSLSQFILESNLIHNHKYNYSKTVYIKDSEKVCIICSEHGEFYQIANNHLQGKGCPMCKNEKLSIERRDTFENFISKSNLIHNNLYSYLNDSYINQLSKIEINCDKHGIFKQTPHAHLRGQGCPKCNNSKGEIMILNWLKINYPDLEIIQQYRAIWLNGLIYDFYIPSLNLAIEYNGIQHYQSVDFFGGDDYFNYCVNNDKLKDKYSNENQTILIKIKYNNEEEDMMLLKTKINNKLCFLNA